MQAKKNKNKRLYHFLVFTVIVFTLTMLVGFCFTYQKYKQESLMNHYIRLEVRNTKPEINSPSESMQKPLSSSTTNQNILESIDSETVPLSKEISDAYSIDFLSVTSQFPLACAWITIPDSKIDYVIGHTDDNDYFLNHTIWGDIVKSGSLFLDYRNNSITEDNIAIIYGHNMHDGSMFGTLKNYEKEAYCHSHSELILHTKDTTLTYNLLAVGHTTDCDSYVYSIPPQYSVEEMLSHIQAKVYDEINDQPKLVLSTCIVNDQRRIVVFQRH